MDGTYKTVLVTPSTTAEQACSQITKVPDPDYGWSIVEVWKDEHIGNVKLLFINYNCWVYLIICCLFLFRENIRKSRICVNMSP